MEFTQQEKLGYELFAEKPDATNVIAMADPAKSRSLRTLLPDSACPEIQDCNFIMRASPTNSATPPTSRSTNLERRTSIWGSVPSSARFRAIAVN